MLTKSIIGNERKAAERVAQRSAVLMEKIIEREYPFGYGDAFRIKSQICFL